MGDVGNFVNLQGMDIASLWSFCD